jgi:multisubunit Na+/H+ antiporter MnhC subunit
MKHFDFDELTLVMIIFGAIVIALAVAIIVAVITCGIESGNPELTHQLIDPANPASPVHQLLF